MHNICRALRDQTISGTWTQGYDRCAQFVHNGWHKIVNKLSALLAMYICNACRFGVCASDDLEKQLTDKYIFGLMGFAWLGG